MSGDGAGCHGRIDGCARSGPGKSPTERMGTFDGSADERGRAKCQVRVDCCAGAEESFTAWMARVKGDRRTRGDRGAYMPMLQYARATGR